MAEVWLASRNALSAGKAVSKTVAVKLLARNLAANQQYRELFLEEARLSMLLNNSNIVHVFDADEIDGECFMAMEWIDGANLAQLQTALWQAGYSIPIDIAMYIVGEVLRALDYAHNLVHDKAATIVHRDVSPANIMLSMSGEVKLTDFGVARFGTEETSGIHVKGKVRYMPQEQLSGDSKVGTVDLYSVGAILHEMLDGCKFRGTQTTEAEIIGMIFAGLTPKLAEPRRVPERLESLRKLLLQPKASQRVKSARAALQMLHRCPGYRNAGIELGSLVRWYRAGADPDSSEIAWLAQPEPVASEAEAEDTSISRRQLLPPIRRTRWWRKPLPISRKQQLGAAIALALAGLGVSFFGVTVAVRNLDIEPLSVVAETTDGNRPAWPHAASMAVAKNAEPAPQPLVSPPKRGEKVLPPPKPVSVELVAGSLGFAYVKVGKKEVLIDPKLTIKLRPGKYKIQVRQKPTEKWAAFGNLTVVSGQTYVVQLLRPNGVKITKQQ